MPTAYLVLTANGLDLARRCRDASPDDADAAIFLPGAIAGPAGSNPGPIPGTFAIGPAGEFAWSGPLGGLVPEVWGRFESIVAVMALGIVVRLIGPLASDKGRDPAVVVVDDAGRFVISVLGGHRAGANRLAERLARVLGAEAVVTTASDAAGLPAVDLIGRERGWVIERAENLTRVAADVVRRRPVAVWQDAGDRDWYLPFGRWPDHFRRVEGRDELESVGSSAVLAISDRALPASLPAGRTLVYRPPTLVAGIGCKRGTSAEAIGAFVAGVMAERGLAENSLAAVATVMLKVDEPGLIAFARSRGLPLVAFPAGQIADHPGIETPSERVRSKVGLAAVAEPSALRAAGASRLLVTKQKGPGITLALARRTSDAATDPQ